jgi:importin subunit alpha-1
MYIPKHLFNFFNRQQSEQESSSLSSPTGDAKRVYNASDIPSLLLGMKSADVSVQLESLRGFRRLLSLEKNAPVKQCIETPGAMDMFVNFLQKNFSTELQFEATWVLTNIASSEYTEAVAAFHAIPPLVALLLSANADIREQCAWCLGNVAGDGPKLRDLVLNAGALGPILQNIQNPASVSLLRNCTWSLSNMCRGKPQPPLALIAPALASLANILIQNNDQETVADATWALSYVSDGDNQRIQSVVEVGVVPYLTRILGTQNNQTMVPALRTLGNIVSGDEAQTQSVIDSNALIALVPLLSHAKKNIRKETCWLLSNIAAGTLEQLSQLTNTPQLLSRVLEQLSSSAEWDVRKEACHVVNNLVSGGQISHINQLIEYGGLAPLCDLLSTADIKILLIALDALECVLRAGGESERARYTVLIDEAGGIEQLENLQEHENSDVYLKSIHIIETYFGCENEEESENIAPQKTENVNGQSVFNFGLAGGLAGKQASGFNFGGPSTQSNGVEAQSQFQFGN